jgi:hypothetical protein
MLLILLALYSLVGLLLARSVAGHIAWSAARKYGQSRPDGDDWIAGGFGGGCAGLIWPVALAWIVVGRLDCLAIGAERAHIDKEREARLERERQEQARRMRELEAALDEATA